MASKKKGHDKVTAKVFFLDKIHRLGSQPHVTLELDRTAQVAGFLLTVQKQHRSDCQNGRCSSCVGSILVKSAWLLEDIPNATAACLESGLDHDPINGVEFMVSDSKILDYEEIAFKDVIIVLCECTSDSKFPLPTHSWCI
jgi:ferredoxin